MTIATGRTTRKLAVPMAALALLASCASIESPKLVLEGVDCRGVSVEGLEFDLHLAVENPNDFGVEASELEYNVYVDGEGIAHGVRSDRVEVPASGSVDVSIPLTLEWAGVAEAFDDLKSGGTHEWKLEGRVTLHKGMYGRTFTFVEAGDFSTGTEGDGGDRAPQGL
jgi:LEA14-like dessication related protein